MSGTSLPFFSPRFNLGHTLTFDNVQHKVTLTLECCLNLGVLSWYRIIDVSASHDPDGLVSKILFDEYRGLELDGNDLLQL